jgi:hypothetical protein
MKGRLTYEKWTVIHIGGQSYCAERIVESIAEIKYINSHCLACAKADVLSKFGGEVDMRGWHLQGICGTFLKSMSSVIEEENNEEN